MHSEAELRQALGRVQRGVTDHWDADRKVAAIKQLAGAIGELIEKRQQVEELEQQLFDLQPVHCPGCGHEMLPHDECSVCMTKQIEQLKAQRDALQSGHDYWQQIADKALLAKSLRIEQLDAANHRLMDELTELRAVDPETRAAKLLGLRIQQLEQQLADKASRHRVLLTLNYWREETKREMQLLDSLGVAREDLEEFNLNVYERIQLLGQRLAQSEASAAAMKNLLHSAQTEGYASHVPGCSGGLENYTCECDYEEWAKEVDEVLDDHDASQAYAERVKRIEAVAEAAQLYEEFLPNSEGHHTLLKGYPARRYSVNYSMWEAAKRLRVELKALRALDEKDRNDQS